MKRIANPDGRPVRHLSFDEHRYRKLRFFRDPTTTKRRRYETWMTTLLDLDTGVVLGVVDGRGRAGVKAWFSGVQVVAIDPGAAFRKAITDALPHAAVSIDHFHLVQLANQMLTTVRQRVSRDVKGRRGRTIDPLSVTHIVGAGGSSGQRTKEAHAIGKPLGRPSGTFEESLKIGAPVNVASVTAAQVPRDPGQPLLL